MLRFGNDSAPAVQQFEGRMLKQRQDRATGRMYLAAAEGANVLPNNSFANGRTLDISWLPACAPRYNISAQIHDYVITEIPIVTVGKPNRNLDCFPLKALMEFNASVGRIAFQTFIGKPTHQDHDNREPLRAKGVIFDSRIVQGVNGGRSRVHILAGWDRTKDPTLVNAILKRERTGYSMGAIVEYTMCSIPNCGATSPDGRIMCAHMEGGVGKGRYIRIGSKEHLVYEECYGINYIENSSVGDPADFEAHDVWVQ